MKKTIVEKKGEEKEESLQESKKEKTGCLQPLFGLALIALAGYGLWYWLFGPDDGVNITKVMNGIKDESVIKIESVMYEDGVDVVAEFKDGTTFDGEVSTAIYEDLSIKAVGADIPLDESIERRGWFGRFLSGTLTVAQIAFWLFAALVVIVVAGSVASIDYKSIKSSMFGDDHEFEFVTSETRFTDVAGIDEVIESVKPIVSFLQDPERMTSLGARPLKGILLSGKPGNGKTLLAQAIAGEAGVPFLLTSGSVFMEKYIGVGAGRVRKLFKKARESAPCIIFIDEIDAVARSRDDKNSNSEEHRTINQILTEMDGFSKDAGVIVLAATNKPEVLDEAVTRKGRFDRTVHVPYPSREGRRRILEVTIKNRNVPLADNVNLNAIAGLTPGFSGADMANLVNEAALLATHKRQKSVTMLNFVDARDEMIMGTDTPIALSPEEEGITAVHECGHALIAYRAKHLDPIYKVTVIPSGSALGRVVQLPEKERYMLSRGHAKEILALLLAGRIAEMKYLKDTELVTAGASSDLQRATALATKMVEEWDLGNVNDDVMRVYRKASTNGSTDMPDGHRYTLSQAALNRIDEEVNQLMTEAKQHAEKIFEANQEFFKKMTAALLARKTLTLEDIKALEQQ